MNIQKWMKEIQDEFDISDNQIIAAAIDSARNMTRATDDFIKNLAIGEEADREDGVEVEFTEDEPEPEPDEQEEGVREDNRFDNDVAKAIQMDLDVDDNVDENDDDSDADDSEWQALYEGYEDIAAIRMHCVAHKLQLAIKDYFDENVRIKRLLTVAQKLAAKLRNPIMRQILSDAKMNQAKLDQVTRWSSTYLMLVQLLQMKEFCVQKAPLFPGLHLTPAVWKDFEDLCDALKPLAELTTRLQHEQLDVTQFVAHWKLAIICLDKLNTVKSKGLLRCVRKRQIPIFENLMVNACIYLDKRFSFTLAPGEINNAKKMIFRTWRKRKWLEGEVADPDDDVDVETPGPDTFTTSVDEMDGYLDGGYLQGLMEAQARRK